MENDIEKIIPRWSIREILELKENDNSLYEMKGISYNEEPDGNWVLYSDVRNLIEDNRCRLRADTASDILFLKHNSKEVEKFYKKK